MYHTTYHFEYLSNRPKQIFFKGWSFLCLFVGVCGAVGETMSLLVDTVLAHWSEVHCES